MRRAVLYLVVLSACASGEGTTVDAGTNLDGADPTDAAADATVPIDSSTPGPDGASIDAANPPPDAMLPPDAAPPDACTPGWIELLGNGDFDSGNTVWQSTSNGGAVIRQYGGGYPWPTHSGSWGAIFLGYNSGSQSLTQSVTVPAGTTSLRLNGFGCFVTEETTTTTVYDTLILRVRRGAVTLAEKLYSNLDAGATCGWAALGQLLPVASPGDTLTVELVASSDSSSLSSFGIDSLRFEALACP